MTKQRIFGLMMVLLVAGWMVGCGKDGDDDNGGDPEPSANLPLMKEGKGTIDITVLFEGPTPKRARPQMGTDKVCTAANKEHPILREKEVVDEHGNTKTVRNAVVFISKFPTECRHNVPKEVVVLDQMGCTYIPHVITIMRNQSFRVKNSDDTEHNVKFLGKKNPAWNDVTGTGAKLNKKFKKTEMGAKLACNVHSWMGGWINIFDHPFHGVTAKEGVVSFKGLPDGEYEISLWHETYEAQTLKVTLKDGKAQTASFTIKKG